jgi:hypothetical protein
VQATSTRPRVVVSADGDGLASHAGTRLLADAIPLTAKLSVALDGVRGQRPRHDPGRVLVDVAVAIADGTETISDIAVLADRPRLFGPVASDSTVWRLLGCPRRAGPCAGRVGPRCGAGGRLGSSAEATGVAFGRSRVAGTPGLDVLVIDLDAQVLVCHSEKDTSGRNTSSPPTASAGYLGRKTAAASVTAGLRQSRQNSLPSGSVITMKPALIGGAGS